MAAGVGVRAASGVRGARSRAAELIVVDVRRGAHLVRVRVRARRVRARRVRARRVRARRVRARRRSRRVRARRVGLRVRRKGGARGRTSQKRRATVGAARSRAAKARSCFSYSAAVPGEG